jgi:integrase
MARMGKRNGKRYFGNVRRLPSDRYQARYTGPDGLTYAAKTPEGKPLTFDTQGDADAWLALRHSEILRGAWLPPAEPKAAPVLFRTYATAWLASRDLEDTTADHYDQLLRDHILPTFGAAPVASITPAAVRDWHAGMKDRIGPTARAHAYGLLRTIMNTAVADDAIPANPCRVRGAGQSKRVKKIRPATLAELETLVGALPARYRLMVLFAAWCALRFGELTELRRSDVDVTNGILRVRRGVVTTRKKGRVVKGPKSDAGKRDVNIPPHLMPLVKAHLRDHVVVGRNALLFPSAGDADAHMALSTLYKVYRPARAKAGRPDLRFHDLRHTGAVLAAATGATLAELMARLGHSTAGAALRYQHAAEDRDKAIAEALSKLAGGTVLPLPTSSSEGSSSGSRSPRR